MSKHSKELKNYPDSFNQLATELGDLTYDSLANFLQELSNKLAQDAKADEARGRKKLAKCLYEASEKIGIASASIDTAWDICEPYMK